MARSAISAWNPLGQQTPTVAPSAPTVVQTTLPTSAYGQTIPVVYGKARMPGAYVWSDIQTITEETQSAVPYASIADYLGGRGTVTETSVRVLMSARLRFGRPLVPDSSWALRKLWANGKLVYDASSGYRLSGLTFRFYDGVSTRGRDPLMVALEGEDEVSAHRGYLDLVVEDLDVAGLGGPPVFEAEVIQGAAESFETDSFTVFSADAITGIAVDWDSGTLYALTQDALDPPPVLRRFSISSGREVFSVPMDLGTTVVNANALRYLPLFNRLLTVDSFSPQPVILINADTGAQVAESADGVTSTSLIHTGLVTFANGYVFIAHNGASDPLAMFRIEESAVARTHLSADPWGGYANVRCITPGEVRGDQADVWICADDHLVKLVVTSSGALISTGEFATFSDNPTYAVFHDGDVIVFTDGSEAIRIDGSTGSTVWTETIPYTVDTIPTEAPDKSRYGDTFYHREQSELYFTSLDTGETVTVSWSGTAGGRTVYDNETQTEILTLLAGAPQKRSFNTVGDGTQRNLSDFLEALMVHGGGYAASEIDVIGVDDVIDGAVIDVTGGVRDIARSVCEPYSIAMFERAGQIIFKRAATDDSFALDATLSASDFRDQI